MKKYRKKPVVIEAFQWLGNCLEIPAWACSAYFADPSTRNSALLIVTLEGTMRADIGDWIIKGVKGEYYPCKPDIFEMTYEEVEGNGS